MDIATKDQFLSKKYRKFYFDPQKYCSKYLDFHVKTQLFLEKKLWIFEHEIDFYHSMKLESKFS